MAIKPLCKVGRCGKPRSPVGQHKRWLYSHARHDGDDCLIWPFLRNNYGYGVVRFRGPVCSAARAMCILAHGEPATPKHETAHSCGNGHLGCINPKHLRWSTRSENHKDKIAHGTHRRGERHSGAVLKRSDVLAIRAMRGTIGIRAIAESYGVSKSLISAVQTGKRWGWLV